MHTHPSTFPASVVSVHTAFVAVLPEHGVVQLPLSAVPAAHAGGVADG
jgi:hypothetical protein